MAPTDIEEGMRVGVDRQKYQIMVRAAPPFALNLQRLVAPQPARSVPTRQYWSLCAPSGNGGGIQALPHVTPHPHPPRPPVAADPAAAQDRCQRDDDDGGGEAGRDLQVRIFNSFAGGQGPGWGGWRWRLLAVEQKPDVTYRCGCLCVCLSLCFCW